MVALYGGWICSAKISAAYIMPKLSSLQLNLWLGAGGKLRCANSITYRVGFPCGCCRYKREQRTQFPNLSENPPGISDFILDFKTLHLART